MNETLPEHEVRIDENADTNLPVSKHYEDLTKQGE